MLLQEDIQIYLEELVVTYYILYDVPCHRQSDMR